MDLQTFLEIKETLKKMITNNEKITQPNLLKNGINTDIIKYFQANHIWGFPKGDEGLIYINWHSNKFIENATMSYLEWKLKEGYYKSLERIYRDIELLADTFGKLTTEIADDIENHFQFGV